MEFKPCNTYHSVYPKYQTGSYAQVFKIDPNQQNQYFVAHPQDQQACLGTQVVCYDVKFGALAPGKTSPTCVNQSLRAQALRNQQLRTIIAGRPETQVLSHTAGCSSCGPSPSRPQVAVSGPQVRPWWGLH